MPALREMQLLAELRHPNVLQVRCAAAACRATAGPHAASSALCRQLHDVFTYKSKVHLVLEYCPTSLEDIISDKSLSLSPADVKALFQMALRGVGHCHKCSVLHRVCRQAAPHDGSARPLTGRMRLPAGFEAEQLLDGDGLPVEAGGLWACEAGSIAESKAVPLCCHTVSVGHCGHRHRRLAC